MGDGALFPNEWAKLISELIDRPGWTQQRLADTAGVDRGTIRRWRKGESANVSAKSIRLIANAAGINEDEAARAALGAKIREDERDDEAIREVLESDIPERYKQEIIDHIRSRRTEAEETLRREIAMLLRAHRAAS